MRAWIAANPERLDRLTVHLACRQLAQHASRETRRARNEADGVFSLGGGKWRARVEATPPRAPAAEEEEASETSSRVIHGAIARIVDEVTNAHEWSRLLDGAATLARAGVTCGDEATFVVDDDANEKDDETPTERASRRTATLSDAALWRVTARGSAFASACSPADLVNNLKALAAIAETRPASICPAGAGAVSRAAYARAVEWSDFELKSAAHALDRLVAFQTKAQTYVARVATRVATRVASDAAETDDPSDPKEASVETETRASSVPKSSPKKNPSRRRRNADPSGKTPKPAASVATSHAFAEGFDATRALVRAVAAARGDGTLMRVARRRGGAKKAGSETRTRVAREKKPPSRRGDDAEARFGK